MDHMLTFQVLAFADLEASFESISHLPDMKHVKKANIVRYIQSRQASSFLISIPHSLCIQIPNCTGKYVLPL